MKEVLVQRALKTNIQILHGKSYIYIFDNANAVLFDFSFVEARRPGSNPINDDDIVT